MGKYEFYAPDINAFVCIFIQNLWKILDNAI